MDPQTERDLRYLAQTERTLQAMRDRICEPKNDTNPAYTGFSRAVSGVRKAADAIRAEEATRRS